MAPGRRGRDRISFFKRFGHAVAALNQSSIASQSVSQVIPLYTNGMRIGLLANSKVSVSAFVEEGDRVIAHVHRVGDDDLGPAERFLVAEVHDGQITHLCGYATEPEARDALHPGAPPEGPPD